MWIDPISMSEKLMSFKAFKVSHAFRNNCPIKLGEVARSVYKFTRLNKT